MKKLLLSSSILLALALQGYALGGLQDGTGQQYNNGQKNMQANKYRGNGQQGQGQGQGYGRQNKNGSGYAQGKGQGGGQHQHGTFVLSDTTKYNLTSEQKQELVYMYQEEKLARDVYAYFADKYDQKIFSNITSAEQQHMSVIGVILDKYAIDTELSTDKAGVFSIDELSSLYATLTTQGNASLLEALKVGRAVEELDIKDLKVAIATANPDAKEALSHLLEASYRHLDAFNRNIARFE